MVQGQCAQLVCLDANIVRNSEAKKRRIMAWAALKALEIHSVRELLPDFYAVLMLVCYLVCGSLCLRTVVALYEVRVPLQF